MKRAGLIGMCLFLALSPAAYAFDTVDAAYSAVYRAGKGLEAQAEDAMRGEDPDVAAALVGFSKIAAEARDTMDALEGPHDLRCIFNGMSEDAIRRAEQLKAAADDADARKAALEDIAFLGSDATLVVPESAAEGYEDPAGEGLPPMECDAKFDPVQAADLGGLLAK